MVAVIATVGLVAVPGTASAAGRIDPVLDCYMRNKDGSYTIVAGYSNPGEARTIALGPSNRIYPSRLQGVQPTAFRAGTQHAVFTATLTAAEVAGNARWELDGRVLDYGDAATASSTCPASTQLPEDGNGTGPAIALLLAGVIGAVAARRLRRRSETAVADRAGAGRDDA